MSQIFLIALRNVFLQRRRSLLLGSAIGFVTFLLVAAFSFSSAIRDGMIDSATTLASGHVNITGFYKVSPSHCQTSLLDYEPLLESIQERFPELKRVERRARGNFDKISSEAATLGNAIIGVTLHDVPRLKERLTLLEGSFDALSNPEGILLFQRQAEELDVGIGDRLIISGMTARGLRMRVDVEVVAIAKDVGGISQLMSLVVEEKVIELYQLKPENTGALMLYVDSPHEAEHFAEALRGFLQDSGFSLMEPESLPFWQKKQLAEREDWTGYKLDVSTWRDELGDLANIADALDAVSVVLTFILLLIIAIGLWNTLFMAVRERTKEIGALRAIGMSRTQVRLMFLSEAGFLALLAAIAGTLLAILAIFIVNAMNIEISQPNLQFILMSDRIRFMVEVPKTVVAIALIVGFSALAALWPAHRAAMIEPGQAMGHAS